MKSASKLTLGTLLSVREVILTQNLTYAAERLGVSQSAVSQQIDRFEKLTGLRVASRNGNSMNVASGHLKSVILEAAAALTELRNLAMFQEPSRIRLGICSYLGASYCQNEKVFRELWENYSLQIAGSATLMDLFQRGELDIVIRPMFHHERELELAVDVPILWVLPKEKREFEGTQKNTDSRKLILEASPSPFQHYVEGELDRTCSNRSVLACVDDLWSRQRLATANSAYFFIPSFASPALSSSSFTTSHFSNSASIRYGFFSNDKRVPLNTALSLFDGVSAQFSQSLPT